MTEAKKNRESNKNQSHLVLICDETGIFKAFTRIKEQLGNNDGIFLSLIYSVPKFHINPLFEREIAILEKRFSHHFYAYILKVQSGKNELIHEIIETIINSNTRSTMQFLIFGNEEFADHVSVILEYLNIDIFYFESNSDH